MSKGDRDPLPHRQSDFVCKSDGDAATCPRVAVEVNEHALARGQLREILRHAHLLSEGHQKVIRRPSEGHQKVTRVYSECTQSAIKKLYKSSNASFVVILWPIRDSL